MVFIYEGFYCEYVCVFGSGINFYWFCVVYGYWFFVKNMFFGFCGFYGLFCVVWVWCCNIDSINIFVFEYGLVWRERFVCWKFFLKFFGLFFGLICDCRKCICFWGDNFGSKSLWNIFGVD